jgi:hypothetical protein
MAAPAYWKLRRLATRAHRVAERRRGESAALAACAQTLGPAATAYIASYDATQRYEPQLRREMREGRGTVAMLLSAMREWLPLIVRDVPDFDRTTFADSNVPDDVLEDGERLIETVETTLDANDQPLPYADAAMQTLTEAYEAARKEWAEAEAADSKYQQMLAEVRRLGGNLHEELKAFRRTLAIVATRSDKDYQKLRIERAGTPDEEDDPAAPQPTVTEPAPADATGPETSTS